mmetsp:Transcript_18070/g.29305  ORF Transcript_18070/g.29305 Transcript_18070/m.29305 type:complete len:276 (-) Transcript_18070:216-1043(-)|eukprot:CAMPEP_0203785206 /NCGR_PEP_ID=MMETSP0100_2-20121128/897_1 /ASSEMBLY_ACC=CAM_ASM_000210 /TAXON_ID=96639 /ORGANISM=" , Strain NY0313808BC1" /LENGTH=275 /DNA_ID=CAMNT_0050687281 /DNA_START=137 /DNA_END=964 /DNA_ORIENTATION=-
MSLENPENLMGENPSVQVDIPPRYIDKYYGEIVDERRELFKDILDNVILDVRQHEDQLLRRNQELEAENFKLEQVRERAEKLATKYQTKRVHLDRKEKKLEVLQRTLEKREKTLTRRERQHGFGSQAPEDPCSDAVLEYMTKCEELVNQPRGAINARRGLTENSPLEEIKSIMPKHMEEIEKSFDSILQGFHGEISRLISQVENSGRAESKMSSNGLAASRIREKKANREKKELLQAMISMENLASKVLASGTSSTELETVVKISQIARGKVTDS